MLKPWELHDSRQDTPYGLFSPACIGNIQPERVILFSCNRARYGACRRNSATFENLSRCFRWLFPKAKPARPAEKITISPQSVPIAATVGCQVSGHRMANQPTRRIQEPYQTGLL
jgi:hypothetical protein